MKAEQPRAIYSLKEFFGVIYMTHPLCDTLMRKLGVKPTPGIGVPVIKVDGKFLYQVGAEIHPLTTIHEGWSKGQVLARLFPSETWLDQLLNRSIYRLQTCWPSGIELLETVRRVKAEYLKDGVKMDDKVEWYEKYSLTSQATTFETVLSAELQFSQLYLVQPKGGFDVLQLAENGIAIFPSALPQKVPEGIADARDAARCIAFMLPTAAAFHMHRLHELVLRRYYDTVTNGAARPVNRNIGAYIDAMKNNKIKDPKIFSALASLKDFHRNPVLHPDDRLEDVEEALALLGSINTVITYMLKALAPEPLKLTSPPSNEAEIKALELKAPAATE